MVIKEITIQGVNGATVVQWVAHLVKHKQLMAFKFKDFSIK